jgi:hypothetical protein
MKRSQMLVSLPPRSEFPHVLHGIALPSPLSIALISFVSFCRTLTIRELLVSAANIPGAIAADVPVSLSFGVMPPTATIVIADIVVPLSSSLSCESLPSLSTSFPSRPKESQYRIVKLVQGGQQQKQ